MLTKSRKLDVLFLSIILTISGFYIGTNYASSFTGVSKTLGDDFIEVESVNATYYYLDDTNITDRLGGDYTGLGAIADTLDTGQGANELYDMDQNVLTTSDTTFASVNTTSEFYRDGENYTSWIDHQIADSQVAFVTHVVDSASELETLVEAMANNTNYYVIANWTGSSTASIVLPNCSGVDLTIHGLGRDLTELQGRANEATIESLLSAWESSENFLRIRHIMIDANSDATLLAHFWHTQVDDVYFSIRANANAKGIIAGGAGAPTTTSTWTDWEISLRDGVTTNSIVRFWYESFVSINCNVVIQASSITEIGNVFELYGTSSAFFKTNLHQWNLQNITGAIWYLAGSSHYCTIVMFYGAQSGGTDSTLNSLVRVGGDSYAHISGTISSGEEDLITKLFYDEYSGNRTTWAGHFASTGAYQYDPAPPAITLNLFDRITASTTYTLGAGNWEGYIGFNNFTLNLTPYTKCAIFGEASGNNAGDTKTLYVWDWTNNQSIAQYEWIGTAEQEFYNATVIQSITGDIQIGMAMGHSGSASLYLRRVYVVFW